MSSYQTMTMAADRTTAKTRPTARMTYTQTVTVSHAKQTSEHVTRSV